MTTDNAIAVLRRMQDPDPFEPQITQVAFDALEMAIQALSAKGDMVYRQAVIDALHGYFDGMLETDTWSPCDVYGLIEILPSAQSEIIRCRDCKHCEHWYADKGRCFLWHEGGIDVFGDGFCNYAEREE